MRCSNASTKSPFCACVARPESPAGEQRERALLFRQLTTVALDAPLPEGATPFNRLQADAGMLGTLSDGIGFGPITRRRLFEAANLPLPTAAESP